MAAQGDDNRKQRAQATLALFGLTKRPNHGLTREQLLRGSDNRWRGRSEAWEQATDALNDLRKSENDEKVQKWIIQSVEATGFWSVWMTVFREMPAMQTALCQSFKGTAQDRV
ncbi:MAG: hypothetical protein KAI47_03375 [Deltaproteobacteria bacterium]|nr:hypothetical protein [Deltaproteobacteria bacterium]